MRCFQTDILLLFQGSSGCHGKRYATGKYRYHVSMYPKSIVCRRNGLLSVGLSELLPCDPIDEVFLLQCNVRGSFDTQQHAGDRMPDCDLLSQFALQRCETENPDRNGFLRIGGNDLWALRQRGYRSPADKQTDCRCFRCGCPMLYVNTGNIHTKRMNCQYTGD